MSEHLADRDRRQDAAPRPGDTDTGLQRVVSGVALELDDVTKVYPGTERPAVDKLSLHIPAGEIVMFVGPSGCGKTTSLKMINRLIEPTSGTITIDGEDIRTRNVDELRRTIGYVIQGGSLFPHMTVAENVGLVPGLLKWDKKRIAERGDELLDLVGLDPAKYRDRFPRELSGGQQQRVGVARGLAADPPVVLMDEPFGAVDPITRQRLQDELLAIQRRLGKTIVMVTHDIDEAIKLGDRILLLREGAEIAQYDTPEAILAAPADSFVEDFVGAGSALKQLSLSRVDDIELRQPVTATLGEPGEEVRRRIDEAGERSAVLLDERRRPVGWVWKRSIPDGPLTAPPEASELLWVDRQATLNDALDTMLASAHGGAIVTGSRDRYRGVVTFEAVTDHIRAAAENAAGQAPGEAEAERAAERSDAT